MGRIESYIKEFNDDYYPANYPFRVELLKSKDNGDEYYEVAMFIWVPADFDDNDIFDIDSDPTYNHVKVFRVTGSDEDEIVRSLKLIKMERFDYDFYRLTGNQR